MFEFKAPPEAKKSPAKRKEEAARGKSDGLFEPISVQEKPDSPRHSFLAKLLLDFD